MIGLKPVGPDMRTALGVNKLHIHLNPVGGPAHAPFEDIMDPELTAELLHVDRFALVGESGTAGDDKRSGNPRQICGQILGYTIGEILLLRVSR